MRTISRSNSSRDAKTIPRTSSAAQRNRANLKVKLRLRRNKPVSLWNVSVRANVRHPLVEIMSLQ